LLLALVLLPTALLAQSGNAAINGAITDPTGAMIPGAQVSATAVDTNVVTRTTTNAEGIYSFPNLPIGAYEIRTSAQGFRDFVQSGIKLNIRDNIRMDISLQLGGSAEAIEVRADAASLNYETAEQKAGVAPETMSELPLMVSNGVRSSAGFITLLPGTATVNNDVGSAHINGGVSYQGASILNGTALVNPAGQNGIISAAMDFSQSPDMISELQVLQSNFEPQYQSSGFVMLMETKSGTNKFHGTAFEFLRNTALNARQFNVAKKPIDIENDIGVSLGGPIKVPYASSHNNKAYFFFSWEGFRQTGAPTRPTFSIPSLKERKGDFSDWVDTEGNMIPIYDPATTRVVNGVTVRDQFMGCDGRSPNVICSNRLNASALKWFSFLPQPTSDGPLNNYVPRGNGSNWTGGVNIYNGRYDQYIGDKDHITFTVYRRDQPTDRMSL
jgi:hypothetical protein